MRSWTGATRRRLAELAICDDDEADVRRSTGVGRIASVVGRYYAMDRDRRWERTESRSTCSSPAPASPPTTRQTVRAAIRGWRDRRVHGRRSSSTTPGEPTVIRDGDVVIFFNFRADRARQLTQALVGPRVEGQASTTPRRPHLCDDDRVCRLSSGPVAFPAIDVVIPAGARDLEAGLRQFHTAETEKYAHVTYFFNGGREEPFEGEERGLVPSPKVATYDLQPEMSADGVGTRPVAAIRAASTLS